MEEGVVGDDSILSFIVPLYSSIVRKCLYQDIVVQFLMPQNKT